MEGPVTEDEILACEKRSQLLKLAKRFESPISLEHVTSVEDIRTRLLLAVKKRKGEMKDITSVSGQQSTLSTKTIVIIYH